MSDPTVSTPPRRRIKGEERRRLIVESAAAQFADHGFATSTRALAEAMGTTQALLYRYYPSKDALIDAVFRHYFLNPEPRGDVGALTSREMPLDQRLARFYAGLFERMSETRLRLFLRAALDRLPLPARYASRLDQRVLWPVLDALRLEAGLPPLATRSPTLGERELVMMLHGSIVFLGIRRYIYRIALAQPVEALIAQQARVFTPGALEQVVGLQELGAEDPLGVRLQADPVSL